MDITHTPAAAAAPAGSQAANQRDVVESGGSRQLGSVAWIEAPTCWWCDHGPLARLLVTGRWSTRRPVQHHHVPALSLETAMALIIMVATAFPATLAIDYALHPQHLVADQSAPGLQPGCSAARPLIDPCP